VVALESLQIIWVAVSTSDSGVLHAHGAREVRRLPHVSGLLSYLLRGPKKSEREKVD
jgi:hypothetical protein